MKPKGDGGGGTRRLPHQPMMPPDLSGRKPDRPVIHGITKTTKMKRPTKAQMAAMKKMKQGMTTAMAMPAQRQNGAGGPSSQLVTRKRRR